MPNSIEELKEIRADLQSALDQIIPDVPKAAKALDCAQTAVDWLTEIIGDDHES